MNTPSNNVEIPQDDLLLGNTLIDPTVRTAGRDMVIPVLLSAARAEKMGLPGLTSAELYSSILPLVAISKEDMLPGRADRQNVSTLQHTFRNTFSHQLFKDLLELAPGEDGKKETDLYRITSGGAAKLLEGLLAASPKLRKDEPLTVIPGLPRAMENTIARLMLERLAEIQRTSDAPAVSMSDLRQDIKAELPLSLLDLQIIKNRADTFFDQKARNAVNKVLEKLELVEVSREGIKITDKGRLVVLDMILDRWLPSSRPELSQDSTANERPRALTEQTKQVVSRRTPRGP